MDRAIIERFIKGQASPEEVRKVLKWYYSDDGEFTMAEDIEYLWRDSDQEQVKSKFDRDEIMNRIRQKIESQPRFELPTPKRNPNNSDPFYLLKIAAILVVFLSVGFAVYQWVYQTRMDQQAWQNKPAEFITKSTATGQKFTIFLEDGTRVKLNSESSLKVPEVFSDSDRVVYLSGEAYFEVNEDPSRPFTVVSGNVSTTALGTSFNVNAHADQEEVIISLVSGKVRVNQQSNAVGQSDLNLVLTPGLQAVYSSVKQTLLSAEFNPRKVLGWKDGIIYFEDASWSEIIQKLERWYGVSFIIENSTPQAQPPYTGTFEEESLENVLESLSFTKKFDYRINEPKVYVKFK